MSRGTVFHREGELAVGDDNFSDSVYVAQVAVWVLGACSRIQDRVISRPCLLYTSDAADATPCVDLAAR
eukprot:4769969-Pyramimonas_sp.AAC.1